MDPLFDLQGRVAVVTGAFGQLGREFAMALLERGAKVAALGTHVSDERTWSVFGEFAQSDRFAAAAVDITNASSVDAALDLIEDVLGTPQVLVNNAGVDTQPSAPPEVSGPFEEFPLEVFREVVDVNLTGTFLMTQRVGRRMVRAGVAGSIINVGSIYGMLSPVQDIYAYKEEITGVRFVKPVAYSAAKSGVYNLTRYCATYWGRHGVRVNTLTPSGVWRETQDAQFQHNYADRIPIGRMAQADEFNGAMVFLASDASRYMTGANLVVDGGWTAW